MTHYILTGHKPVPEPDDMAWGAWMITHRQENIIAKTGDGEIEVSTAFLGIDHALNADEPVLFETLVFGSIMDGIAERYHTWDEAVEGHKRMVELVTIAHLQGGDPDDEKLDT